MTEPTPRTEAFTCTCTPLNRRLMAHLLKVNEGDVHEHGCVERAAAQARTEALDVERLAEIINDLDDITGNGNYGDGPKLGLDYGTAHEWATTIVARLTREETP
jgi:hypothetical protein